MLQLSSSPGASDKGCNVNGIWVNQFANHTFRSTLSVNLESNPSQIQHQALWGYANADDGSLLIDGSKNYRISDSFKRQGLLTSFQWKPDDFFNSMLDLAYVNFKETRQAKGTELPLAYGSGVTLQPGYDSQNGFAQSGTYHNVKGVIRNDNNQTKARGWNIGWRKNGCRVVFKRHLAAWVKGEFSTLRRLRFALFDLVAVLARLAPAPLACH